jgi:hypothetical protein
MNHKCIGCISRPQKAFVRETNCSFKLQFQKKTHSSTFSLILKPNRRHPRWCQEPPGPPVPPFVIFRRSIADQVSWRPSVAGQVSCTLTAGTNRHSWHTGWISRGYGLKLYPICFKRYNKTQKYCLKYIVAIIRIKTSITYLLPVDFQLS